MAAQTLPLDYDITCYARTSLVREFRWRPDGVNAQDFTGWSADMLIGPVIAGNIASVELSTSTTGVALTPDGRVIVDVSAATTATWPTSTSRYTLDLTDPTGFVVRFLRGRFTVVHELDPPP